MHVCLSPKLPLKVRLPKPIQLDTPCVCRTHNSVTHSESAFKNPFISAAHLRYRLERRGMNVMVWNGDLVIVRVNKRGGVGQVSTVL